MNSVSDGSEAPLVSVIIPSYNRAHFIAETIESVLRQTHRNIEIIIIDDGSVDETRSVVERFGSKVRYVWQENAGVGAARNHGLRLARGKYIAFLDSDDLWLPTKVETGVDVFEANPAVGLLCTDAMQIDAEGREKRSLRARGRSGRTTQHLLRNNFVIMSTHMARTAVVRKAGGFREERILSACADWELWVRLSLFTEIAYVPGATAKIRTHAANMMSNAAVMRESMDRAAEIIRSSESCAAYKHAFRQMDAYLALLNAINFCSAGDGGVSINFLKEAVSANPWIIFDQRFAYTIFRLLTRSGRQGK